jgi:hypothetical protein
MVQDAKNKRVVGILLGETFKGRIDITHSYAGTSKHVLERLLDVKVIIS